MKLPAEWEAIAQAALCGPSVTEREIVERCYTLATKPPKELTNVEIIDAFDAPVEAPLSLEDWLTRVRKVIAAHEAKQREPETVTFRAAKYKNGPDIQVLRYPNSLNCDWEWLEPPQTFEVVLP